MLGGHIRIGLFHGKDAAAVWTDGLDAASGTERDCRAANDAGAVGSPGREEVGGDAATEEGDPDSGGIGGGSGHGGAGEVR